ncbi:MAG: alpha/beta fold hydrolase [Pseudomonadota bacterium]
MSTATGAVEQVRRPASMLTRLASGSANAPATIALPPGGGNATNFAKLARVWRGTGPLYAVSPPGRLQLFGEAPIVEAGTFVARLLPELDPVEGPIVLFGHSCGAYLAFALAAELAGRDDHRVVSIIVAGAAPPSPGVLDPLLSMSDAEMFDFSVGTLENGLDTLPDMVASAELRACVSQLLRADLMLARSSIDPDRRVAVPIVALAGRADQSVSPEEMDGWGRFTTETFSRHTVAGSHFFPCHAEPDFVACLTDAVSQAVPG